MSDLDRLRAAFRRAAADGRLDPEEEVYADPGDGLALVLRRIDEAVLGRRIILGFGDGTRIDCLVSGRRLVALPAPAPAGLAPAQAALFGRDDLGAEDAQAVAETLLALCGRADRLRVTTERPEVEIDATSGGLAPTAVAAALAIDLGTGAGLRGVELGPLLDAADPSIIAAVLVQDDEIAVLRGEGRDVDAVLAWAEQVADRLLTPAFPLFSGLETGGVLAFSPAEAGGRQIFVAGRRGAYLLAMTADANPVATLDLWRRLAGS